METTKIIENKSECAKVQKCCYINFILRVYLEISLVHDMQTR